MRRIRSLSVTSLVIAIAGTAAAQAPPAEPIVPDAAKPAEAPATPDAAKPAEAPAEEANPGLPPMPPGGAVGTEYGVQPAPAPSHGAPIAPPLSVRPGALIPAASLEAAPPYQIGNPNVGVDGHPLAGYHGGKFYIRDANDYFRIYVGGRLHIDSLNYFGPGVKHTDLKSTVVLRRARLELAGEFMSRWQWEVNLEGGSTSFDNASGTEQTSAAPAGTDPTAATSTYAPVQTARFQARPIQAYVNYRASDAFNVKVGQFNLPFTAENRTGTNSITFLERALPTRTWGVPYTKDIGGMVWGHLDKRMLYWSWAVVKGDCENRPNADNRATTAMRVYTRPLANGKGPLELLQLGASFKYGMHDKDHVAYDYPSMSTQSGYRFWSPTYTDSVGAGRRIHIIPSGAEMGIAGEIRIPYDRFDFRSEFVYLDNDTREGVDGFQRESTERFGTLKGYAYHVTLSYWLLGKAGLTGNPGDRAPKRVDFDKPDPGMPPHALELALRWEQLKANYESAARSGQPDGKNIDGDIKTDVLSVGANYWASNHLRLSVNYALNMFPDSAPSSEATDEQRATAPGNRIARGIDDDTRSDAHSLHEVSARVGVAF